MQTIKHELLLRSNESTPFATAPSSPLQVALSIDTEMDDTTLSTHLDRVRESTNSCPLHTTYFFTVRKNAANATFISVPHLGSSSQGCKALSLPFTTVLEEWLNVILKSGKEMGPDAASSLLDIVVVHLTKTPMSPVSTSLSPSLPWSPSSPTLEASLPTRHSDLHLHVLLGPTSQLGSWCCEDNGVLHVAKSMQEEHDENPQLEPYFVDLLVLTNDSPSSSGSSTPLSPQLDNISSAPLRNRNIRICVDVEYIVDAETKSAQANLKGPPVRHAGLCTWVTT